MSKYQRTRTRCPGTCTLVRMALNLTLARYPCNLTPNSFTFKVVANNCHLSRSNVLFASHKSLSNDCHYLCMLHSFDFLKVPCVIQFLKMDRPKLENDCK